MSTSVQTYRLDDVRHQHPALTRDVLRGLRLEVPELRPAYCIGSGLVDVPGLLRRLAELHEEIAPEDMLDTRLLTMHQMGEEHEAHGVTYRVVQGRRKTALSPHATDEQREYLRAYLRPTPGRILVNERAWWQVHAGVDMRPTGPRGRSAVPRDLVEPVEQALGIALEGLRVDPSRPLADQLRDLAPELARHLARAGFYLTTEREGPRACAA